MFLKKFFDKAFTPAYWVDIHSEIERKIQKFPTFSLPLACTASLAINIPYQMVHLL